MQILILVIMAFSVAMPLAYAIRVWRLDEPSLRAWLLVVAETLAFVTFVLLLARWDMAGLHTRSLLAAALVMAIVFSWFRHRRRPWRAQGESLWRRRWPNALFLAGFAGVLGYVISATLPNVDARPIASPLGAGHFMVVHGGGNTLVNYHASHKAQRHAIDIVALNDGGFRAAGILPTDPAEYAIYGVPVVSPCDGTVIGASDGLPDLAPPQTDRDNAAGNHIVLDCAGIRLELAHLQRGSVTVVSGDRLSVGQPIARVGNSGNSSEPHLHIHAVDPATGNGVPLIISGLHPARNRTFQVEG